MDLDFKAATDRLMAAPRIPDIAGELGVSVNTVARWRVDPEKDASRSPSIIWQAEVARMARARCTDLTKLAERLEREAARLNGR